MISLTKRDLKRYSTILHEKYNPLWAVSCADPENFLGGWGGGSKFPEGV